MIRLLTSSDREQVLKISDQIWEGDDYISYYFDEWITQEEGDFAGYFEGEKLIGFGRFRRLSDCDFWIEGLRKDPSEKLKGIAKRFYNYFLGRAISENASTLRFSTYFDNYKSIHTAEKRGYNKIGTYSMKEKRVVKPVQVSLDVSEAKRDDEVILDFIEKSEYLEKMNGFCSVDWVCYPWKSATAQFLEKVSIFKLEKNGIVKGVLAMHVKNDHTVHISFMDADTKESLSKLLKYAELFAFNNRAENIYALFPLEDKWLKLSDEQGFVNWERDDDFFVYELDKNFLKLESQVCIETDRLYVRHPLFIKDDIDHYYSLWKNPEVMKNVGFPNGLYVMKEQIEEIILSQPIHEFNKTLLVIEKETGKRIGECKMSEPDEKKISTTDIKILPEFQNKGYGVEIKHAITDHIFQNTNAEIVEATPNINNIASIKMQEKNGGVRVRKDVYKFPKSMELYTVEVHYYLYHIRKEIFYQNR